MKPFEMSERLNWAPPMPSDFAADYKLGNYDRDRICEVMWKYLVREVNCQRAWVRINHHMPETLLPGDPLDILEMSTAHGAMLEIWRAQGHRVMGSDYAWAVEGAGRKHKGMRKPWHEAQLRSLMQEREDHHLGEPVAGWPYQPIIESLGLDVRLFDGGVLPYPLADKAFDYVVSYQAIEAYAPPERWLDIIREMCRIARRAVVVGFNPLPVEVVTDDNKGAVTAAHDAWLAMQRFDEAGFRVAHFELGQTRRGLHPTCLKLVAH